MENVLANLTYAQMRSEFGWGYANGDHLVDYYMLRDDVAAKGLSKKVLLKFGIQGIHYFPYLNQGGKKEVYEREVVEYFTKNSTFLQS